MFFKFTAISIKILNNKPNMEYIDKKKLKKKIRGSAHMHIQQQEITLKYK